MNESFSESFGSFNEGNERIDFDELTLSHERYSRNYLQKFFEK